MLWPTPTAAARCTTASIPCSARRTAAAAGRGPPGAVPRRGGRSRRRITHVADHELDVAVEVVGPSRALAVDLGGKVVQRADPIAPRQQRVRQMRADEPRATRDQDMT